MSISSSKDSERSVVTPRSTAVGHRSEHSCLLHRATWNQSTPRLRLPDSTRRDSDCSLCSSCQVPTGSHTRRLLSFDTTQRRELSELMINLDRPSEAYRDALEILDGARSASRRFTAQRVPVASPSFRSNPRPADRRCSYGHSDSNRLARSTCCGAAGDSFEGRNTCDLSRAIASHAEAGAVDGASLDGMSTDARGPKRRGGTRAARRGAGL